MKRISLNTLAFLIIALFLVSGCRNIKIERASHDVVTGTALGWIQKPTAVAFSRLGDPNNSNNITEHSFKYIDSLGKKTMDYKKAVGAGFRIEVKNGHSHFVHPFEIENYNELISYMYVCEYKFPKNGSAKPMVIDWTAKMNLDAVFAGTANEKNWVSFEFIVFEDPLGAFEMGNMGTVINPALLASLKNNIEGTKQYSYNNLEGISKPKHIHDVVERSGQISVLPNHRPKLYLGVSVLIKVMDKDQHVYVREAGQPNTKPHATFKVKNSSSSGNLIWFGPEYSMGFPK